MMNGYNCHAWEGRIVSVYDGDTLTIEPVYGGKRIKVRLHGIDSPERKQPYGEIARSFIHKNFLYKTFIIKEIDIDRYKRVVAILYLKNGISLQEILLQYGMAWVWPRYCNNCEEWEDVQNKSKQDNIGLWGTHNPIPPWEWRKLRKKSKQNGG